MKCKHCNGTGKIRGYFYEKTGVNKWEKVWGDSPCEECNGTGEIEITNEEWFCSLPTEEKARFIADNDGTIQIGDEVDYQNTMKKWSKWLKEKHNGNT